MIRSEKAVTDQPALSVGRMSELLVVSRSGYYAWAARQNARSGRRAAWRADLTVKIRVAHDASNGVNGAPRISTIAASGRIRFRTWWTAGSTAER